MKQCETLIIGAGPAGLAVAGRMHHEGMPYVMLEKSRHVGNAWHHHYDRLHLHTVKEWSHLPHHPFPEHYPRYVSRDQLVSYFESYANAFGIRPVFGKEVTHIRKAGTEWSAMTTEGEIWKASNIIVATGLNSRPKRPEWPGMDSFDGRVMHSIEYRNPKPFEGQQVLVVGMGNTGAELALDLSEHGVRTFLSVRSAITLVPRDLNGRPVQVTARQLEKLPFGFGDWLGSQIRKIYFGNLEKYGIKVSKGHPARLLRETGKTPVIDIGTIKAIKEGRITVVDEIERFTENGVLFKSGKDIPFDAVILATGFRSGISDLIEKGEDLLDSNGYPHQPVAGDFHKGLYFVGFDNYKVGGILGTIYNDSETVVNSIKHVKQVASAP